MSQKRINMVVNYAGVKKLRPLLLRFRSKSSSFNVQKIESGEYKGNILISFFVLENHYDAITNKLESNGIKIIYDDDELKQKITQHLITGGTENEVQSAKKKISLPVFDSKMLNNLLSNGKTEEALNHSKEIIEEGQKLIAGVHSILENATISEIEKIKNLYTSKQKNKKECFTKFVKIASDETVQAIKESGLAEKAGNEAIEICYENDDMLEDLITISNDIKLHSRLNLRAAIKFSEKVFTKEEESDNYLNFAVANLNTKWLTFAHDTFRHDFTEDEINYYNRLISYVKKKDVN